MKTIIKKFFNAKEAWIFLLIGLFLYYIGYSKIEKEIFKQVFIKLGDVLVIGVILGYVTNVSALFGIFKKELEDLIYAEKFLKKRSDLENIWENITKELFKSKFPSIHRELLNIIKKNYLPIENVIYYNDYCVSIDIEWANYERKIISNKATIYYEVICENENSFKVPLKNWINIEGLEKSEYYAKITKCKVNDTDCKVIKSECKVVDNIHELEYIIELSGSTKYDVILHIEKMYSFSHDYTTCFKARYIMNNLKVQVRHPENISTHFISRGTLKDFTKINSTGNFLEMKYKGLLLPEQGYVIVLKEK